MRCIALGLALAIGVVTTPTAEEKFTAADVLEWQASQQNGYFETSIMMAAIVASKNESPAAGCIDDWYFARPDAQASVTDEFRQLLSKYREYHPGLVVSAMIERQCGTLRFTD